MISVIICSGGIVDICVAFYLVERGGHVTVVAQNGFANGASGLKSLPNWAIELIHINVPLSTALHHQIAPISLHAPSRAAPEYRHDPGAFGDKFPVKHALQNGILLL